MGVRVRVRARARARARVSGEGEEGERGAGVKEVSVARVRVRVRVKVEGQGGGVTVRVTARVRLRLKGLRVGKPTAANVGILIACIHASSSVLYKRAVHCANPVAITAHGHDRERRQKREALEPQRWERVGCA